KPGWASEGRGLGVWRAGGVGRLAASPFGLLTGLRTRLGMPTSGGAWLRQGDRAYARCRGQGLTGILNHAGRRGAPHRGGHNVSLHLAGPGTRASQGLARRRSQGPARQAPPPEPEGPEGRVRSHPGAGHLRRLPVPDRRGRAARAHCWPGPSVTFAAPELPAGTPYPVTTSRGTVVLGPPMRLTPASFTGRCP